MSEAGDIDVLAAEYVLGTLDANERAQAQAMLAVDQALAAKVRIWERRLSELHLMVEPIAPEDEIWDRIKAKMALMAPGAKAEAGTAAPTTEAAAAAMTPAPAAATPAMVAPAVTGTPPSWLTRESSSPSPSSLPRAPDLPPLKLSEESESKESEPTESLAEALAAAKAAEAAPSEAAPAESVTETTAETSEKPQSAERSSETVERAPAEAAVAPERSAAADEDGTPSGVFDDMPEPTPAGVVVPPASGPLAGLPPSLTGSAPPLTPAPSATLSVPAPPKAAPISPALAVRPERRPQPQAAPKRGLSRFVATVTTLILLAIAALVAAWRFVPDRVPPPLRPVEVLRAMGIATPVTVIGGPPRRPAPPESRYEE